MGGGFYSLASRSTRATSSGYYTKSANEIFSHSMKESMNPKNAKLRESRDSTDNPKSLAIIVALDLTGSMGHIPHDLVKDGLPTMVDTMLQKKVVSPQILFLGIGDHECDRAPLQVGQFETSDELMDKWLTDIWIEFGGGGNTGESYLLAWYFAAYHTATDCFEKRGQKGFLFTIGDEATLKTLPTHALDNIMGLGQYQNFTAEGLLKEAQKKYNVFHIHVTETGAGRDERAQQSWKQLIGQNVIFVNDFKDIPITIADLVAKNNKTNHSEIIDGVSTKEEVKINSDTEQIEEEIL